MLARYSCKKLVTAHKNKKSSEKIANIKSIRLTLSEFRASKNIGGNREDKYTFFLVTAAIIPLNIMAKDDPSSSHTTVADQIIASQRLHLAKDTQGQRFGPQSPHDIDSVSGSNNIIFSATPAYTKMNLYNIHFHKKAVNLPNMLAYGDGLSDHQYSDYLTKAELAPINDAVCPSKNGSLDPGDTIEVHCVYSTAQINPGLTLGAYLNEAIKNP